VNDSRPTGLSTVYRCGAIEIDATQRQVLIDGTPARIGARALAVLLALVERRDRVVSKQELMDLVWPKLVVEENNLLVHMVALRKLLGQQAIATIPGRGYRFALRVDAVNGGGLSNGLLPSAGTPGNLPPSPPLFGRAEDLQAVDALLSEHSVLSIVGAAGIGKTRLALAAAATANCAFPDGRWWVELAPVTAGAEVANGIAAALGMHLLPGRPPQEALAAALAGRSMLLVLDNCEHVADDVAALVELLRAHAPNVRLLVTSQELLKCRDDQVYRLGTLAVPLSAQVEDAAEFGAVALFVERAHAVDSRFRLADDTVSVVVDICRRLDGIPLAIELAAARIPLLGVHGLHARLNQMFDVLSGGARMKLRRHQTLRAALDWSHGLLSADEQAVFRRLGVFAGGFSLELAQEVVSDERIDPWLVLDLLGRLIDKSLVIVQGEAEPRYRLLEITRAFALEQLAHAGESEAMLRRHAQVICELMSATDANLGKFAALSSAERKRVMLELNNLRAAVDWTLASGDHRMLAYELLSKGWVVWRATGLEEEANHRMQQLWPLPADLPARIEADFCLSFGMSRICVPRDEHCEAARRAETLYRELGDATGLGEALLLIAGFCALSDDSMPEAERALREAELLLASSTEVSKQAPLARTQGELHLRRGEHALAIAAFGRQAELWRRTGVPFPEHIALGNVGCAELDAGYVDAAIESLSRSVAGLRGRSASFFLEIRLGWLALARAWRGDEGDVLPLAREAFEFLRQFGLCFVPLMAAALQHARREDSKRAVLLTGYAYSKLPHEKVMGPTRLPTLQRVRGQATARHPAAAVETWLRAGERLSEGRAAAIAFDDAPLDELCDDRSPVAPPVESDSTPFAA
jgi:predicted ATPase/DNA-binding winged helix-turn-helix (wHTH) protein